MASEKRPAVDNIDPDRAKRANFGSSSPLGEESRPRLERWSTDRTVSVGRREDADQGRRQSTDSYWPGAPRDDRSMGWDCYRPGLDAPNKGEKRDSTDNGRAGLTCPTGTIASVPVTRSVPAKEISETAPPGNKDGIPPATTAKTNDASSNPTTPAKGTNQQVNGHATKPTPSNPAPPPSTSSPSQPPQFPPPATSASSSKSATPSTAMTPNDLATKFLSTLPTLLTAHSKQHALAVQLERVKTEYGKYAKMPRADPKTQKQREEQVATQQATSDEAKAAFDASLASYRTDILAACKEMAASGGSNNEEMATKAELKAMQDQIQRLLSRDAERKEAVEGLGVQLSRLSHAVMGISGALTNRTERLKTVENALADTHKLATTVSSALTKSSEQMWLLEDDQEKVLARIKDVEREAADSSQDLKAVKEQLYTAEKDVKAAEKDAKTAKEAATNVEKEIKELKQDTQTQVQGLAKGFGAFKALNVDRLKHIPTEIETLKVEMQAKKNENANGMAVQELKDEVTVQTTAVSELIGELDAKMMKNFQAFRQGLDEATERMNEWQTRSPVPALASTTSGIPRAQSVDVAAIKAIRQPLQHLFQEHLATDLGALKDAVKDHAKLLEHGFTDSSGVKHGSLIERLAAIEQRLDMMDEMETNVWQKLDEYDGMITDMNRRGTPAASTPAPLQNGVQTSAMDSIKGEGAERTMASDGEIKKLNERVEALEKYQAAVEKTLGSELAGDPEQPGLFSRIKTIEDQYLNLRKDRDEHVNDVKSLKCSQEQGTERIDAVCKSMATWNAAATRLLPEYTKRMDEVAQVAEQVKSIQATNNALLNEQAFMGRDIIALKARPASQTAALDASVRQSLKAELKAELIADINPAIMDVNHKCGVMSSSLMTVSSDMTTMDSRIEQVSATCAAMGAQWGGVDNVRRTALQSLEQRYDALTTVGLANAILEQLRPKVLAARDERMEALRVAWLQQTQALQTSLEAAINALAERVVKIESAEPISNVPAGTLTSAELEQRLATWGPEAEARIVTSFNRQWAEEFKKRLEDDLMPELARLFREIDETRLRVDKVEKSELAAAFTSLQEETARIRERLGGIEEHLSTADEQGQSDKSSLTAAITSLQQEMTHMKEVLGGVKERLSAASAKEQTEKSSFTAALTSLLQETAHIRERLGGVEERLSAASAEEQNGKSSFTAAVTSLQQETALMKQRLGGVEERLSASAEEQNGESNITAAVTLLQQETERMRQRLGGVEELLSADAEERRGNVNLTAAVTLLQGEMTLLQDRTTELETIRVASSPSPRMYEDRLRDFAARAARANARANRGDREQEEELSIVGSAGKAAPRGPRNSTTGSGGGPVRKHANGRVEQGEASENQSSGTTHRWIPRKNRGVNYDAAD